MLFLLYICIRLFYISCISLNSFDCSYFLEGQLVDRVRNVHLGQSKVQEAQLRPSCVKCQALAISLLFIFFIFFIFLPSLSIFCIIDTLTHSTLLDFSFFLHACTLSLLFHPCLTSNPSAKPKTSQYKKHNSKVHKDKPKLAKMCTQYWFTFSCGCESERRVIYCLYQLASPCTCCRHVLREPYLVEISCKKCINLPLAFLERGPVVECRSGVLNHLASQVRA